jgi:hypothetical protein
MAFQAQINTANVETGTLFRLARECHTLDQWMKLIMTIETRGASKGPRTDWGAIFLACQEALIHEYLAGLCIQAQNTQRLWHAAAEDDDEELM